MQRLGGQSTKNSKKCHRTGAEERGAEGRTFPRLPPMGRQTREGFYHVAPSLIHLFVIQQLLIISSGVGTGETETNKGVK